MRLKVEILDSMVGMAVLPNLRVALTPAELTALIDKTTLLFDVELPSGRCTVELFADDYRAESANAQCPFAAGAFADVAAGATVVPLLRFRKWVPFAIILVPASTAVDPGWLDVEPTFVEVAPPAPVRPPASVVSPAARAVPPPKADLHNSPVITFAVGAFFLVLGSFEKRAAMVAVGAGMMLYGLWKWIEARARA